MKAIHLFLLASITKEAPATEQCSYHRLHSREKMWSFYIQTYHVKYGPSLQGEFQDLYKATIHAVLESTKNIIDKVICKQYTLKLLCGISNACRLWWQVHIDSINFCQSVENFKQWYLYDDFHVYVIKVNSLYAFITKLVSCKDGYLSETVPVLSCKDTLQCKNMEKMSHLHGDAMTCRLLYL